jgi:hypothetical protein
VIQVAFKSGSRDQIASLAKELVVAIDLGFAKASASCGIAWKTPNGESSDDSLQFGACIHKACDLMKAHKAAALILEAPLSGLFSAAGNPIERGAFERQATKEGRKVRYWYSGPGAATCLAAIFFCRELMKRLQAVSDSDREITVVLFEGFVSFKKKPKGKKRKKTSHRDEAIRLRDCFLNGPKPAWVKEVRAKDKESVVAITDVLTDQKAGAGPAILRPPARKPGLTNG